jgi:PPOX class probable F420-dependent enzyme
MSIEVGKFRDVSEGTGPGQFQVVDTDEVTSLDDLPDVYKQLLDEPITAIIAVTAPNGRQSLNPIWFDYDGDTLLLNFAEHRKKTGWIRSEPEFTLCLMNPENPYHWVSIWGTVTNEIHEDDPEEGHRATEHVDKIWTKYTGNEPPYGLRDPSMDERRVLFQARIDKVTTFGRP